MTYTLFGGNPVKRMKLFGMHAIIFVSLSAAFLGTPSFTYAQSVSLTPTTSNAPGAACTPNGALSSSGSGFVVCTGGVWVAEPVVIGTQASGCSVAGQVQWNGTAFQSCNASTWSTLSSSTPAGSSGQVQFNNSNVFGATSNLVWSTVNNWLGIGSSSPVATLDMSQNTGAAALPVGTTGQEPGTPVAGMFRYNSTTNAFEAYGGSTPAWMTLLNYSGYINGSVTTSSTTVNLTTVGTTDWVMFNAGTYVHKSTGGSLINATNANGSASSTYNNDARGMTWTSGTPTASGTAVTNGINTSEQGFVVSLPASTTVHTVILYFRTYCGNPILRAHLGDAPSAYFDYVDFSQEDQACAGKDLNYTLTYRAASAGQTLYISFVNAAMSSFAYLCMQAIAYQ